MNWWIWDSIPHSTAHLTAQHSSPYSPLTVQRPSQVTSWLSKLDESYQTNGIHRILLSVASHRCQHHVDQTWCPEAQHTHSQCNSHMWYWSMPPTQFSSMSPRRCTLLSLLITKGTQPSDSSLLCACLRTLQNPLVCCTFSHGTPLWQALANWAAFTYESMDSATYGCLLQWIIDTYRHTCNDTMGQSDNDVVMPLPLTAPLYLYMCACKCQFTNEGSHRLPKLLNYCFSVLASGMNWSIWVYLATQVYIVVYSHTYICTVLKCTSNYRHTKHPLHYQFLGTLKHVILTKNWQWRLKNVTREMELSLPFPCTVNRKAVTR